MNDTAQVFGGAGGGLLFSALYDCLKELISKSIIYKPLLKNIITILDAFKPVLIQIEQSNKELDLPADEVEKFKELLKKGKVIVEKCSEVRKWNIYKKYKYANKFLDWNESLQRHLDILNLQEIRDVKENLVSTKKIEKVVTKIDRTTIMVATQVDEIATSSRHMEKALSRVETTSFHSRESIKQIGTSTTNLEAGMKRIEAKFETVTLDEAKIEAWGAVPELPQIIVGLDVPLKELKMQLFRDDVSVLVLTAPGGCGKTTLATKFCQDEQVKDKFKGNIFFVTVSKTPHLNLIVQELYNTKFKGSQVPNFQDEVTVVKWLHAFLKEKRNNPLLLVLDDVWSGSESLLDKFQFKMPGYKILVTSRSEFPRFGSPYYLQSLDYENAMKLFYHSASLGDKSSHIPPDLSKQIVEGCKGYPLAITVAGGSLCGQSTETWQQRLIEWSKGSSILDSETELLLRLQSSIEASDKEMAIIRECFLDLGSFPEDQRIPVPALIDMWAESYDQLEEDTLCVAYLQRLTNRSLANLVVTRKDQIQGDGYYSEHFVTQHDLLRELAIYETRQKDPAHRERLVVNISGDRLPKWWSEKKHRSMKARLLSISTDGVFSAQWHHMDVPEAEILVLNFQTETYIMPDFLDNMDQLKVLVVTNNGFLPAELSNFQLVGSLSNLKRIRLERISIPSITKNSIQLESLKKISLFMCTIGQAFINSSLKLSYAFPNLEEINIDYCNDLGELPADLCELIHLKKLSITNSHKLVVLPEEIGKLINLEVLRLRSCTDLEKLPGSISQLKKLNLLDISYGFSIMELPEDIGEMTNLRKLNMRECSRLQELPVSVLDLKHLEEVICDEETEGLWKLFLPLGNARIVVAKENINLNWLHKPQY